MCALRRANNHVRFENAGQGTIIPQFARGERNAYGDLPIAIHRPGEATPLVTLGSTNDSRCWLVSMTYSSRPTLPFG